MAPQHQMSTPGMEVAEQIPRKKHFRLQLRAKLSSARRKKRRAVAKLARAGYVISLERRKTRRIEAYPVG
jgi:hypothetical protein